MNVEDGKPVNREFQFDCAHCGKGISGNHLHQL